MTDNSSLIERLERAALVQYQTSQTADSKEEFMEWEAAQALRDADEKIKWAEANRLRSIEIPCKGCESLQARIAEVRKLDGQFPAGSWQDMVIEQALKGDV